MKILLRLVLVFSVAGLAGCFGTVRSTHHAQFRVELMVDAAKQHPQFEDVARVLNEFAAQHEFALVSNATPSHLSYFSTAGTSDTICLNYRSTAAIDKKRPIEILVVYDRAIDPPTVGINFAEGYGSEPSARLRESFDALQQALTTQLGQPVKCSIW